MITANVNSQLKQTKPSNKGNYMNAQIVKGNWNIIKGKLKQSYAQLTDDDLTYVDGKEDELIGRVQAKVGATREEIEHLFRP
jgi:uncharacterized protein YjbJ (UPF0337 family)